MVHEILESCQRDVFAQPLDQRLIEEPADRPVVDDPVYGPCRRRQDLLVKTIAELISRGIGGPRRREAFRSPQVQYFESCSSSDVSKRPSTRSLARWNGEMTPKRSFGETSRLSPSSSGPRWRGIRQPSRARCPETPRARGCADRPRRPGLRAGYWDPSGRRSRTGPVSAHELEGLDLLRLPVFEHLKVRGREALDDPIAPPSGTRRPARSWPRRGRPDAAGSVGP